jgi:hypothetical protein
MRWASVPALLALSACTATLNEAPASGGQCSTDTSVIGCVGSSTGYSCTGGDTPDATDGSLICSAGTAGSAGTTQYCCVDAPLESNACSAASAAVNCGGSSIAFSCQGSGRPDQTNSSLVCSEGAPGNDGDTVYCCAAYMPSAGTCAQDTSVQGCGSSSIGFSCSGSDRPDQVNASLVCGNGTSAGGTTLYCCDTSGTPADTTNACAVDANVVCASPATGYSCSGSATPPQSDSSLDCGQPTTGSNGETAYCCNQAIAPAPGTCMQDPAVTGCTGSTVGYSCTGTATPADADASLTCSAPAAGSGATDYCCSNGAAPPPMCSADAAVTGCPGISTGYTCTGGASPETATLLCGMAMSGSGGTMTFCCTPN